MKSFKNVLSALAFAFAITAAFAFTAPNNSEIATIPVKGQAAGCPEGQVSDQCTSLTDGQICTFQQVPGGTVYQAIPFNTQPAQCPTATVLRNPNL